MTRPHRRAQRAIARIWRIGLSSDAWVPVAEVSLGRSGRSARADDIMRMLAAEGILSQTRLRPAPDTSGPVGLTGVDPHYTIRGLIVVRARDVAQARRTIAAADDGPASDAKLG